MIVNWPRGLIRCHSTIRWLAASAAEQSSVDQHRVAGDDGLRVSCGSSAPGHGPDRGRQRSTANRARACHQGSDEHGDSNTHSSLLIFGLDVVPRPARLTPTRHLRWRLTPTLNTAIGASCGAGPVASPRKPPAAWPVDSVAMGTFWRSCWSALVVAGRCWCAGWRHGARGRQRVAPLGARWASVARTRSSSSGRRLRRRIWRSCWKRATPAGAVAESASARSRMSSWSSRVSDTSRGPPPERPDRLMAVARCLIVGCGCRGLR